MIPKASLVVQSAASSAAFGFLPSVTKLESEVLQPGVTATVCSDGSRLLQ